MATKYRFIDTEIGDDGIATLTLDDVGTKNAVNDVMNAEILDFCNAVEVNDSARVLIVTGAGGAFCSGGNVKQMAASGKSLEAPAESVRQRLYPRSAGIRATVLAFRQLSKPTIAAVNGPAVGSGIGLAAGCDLRVAAESARFHWVFVRRGIVPDDASLALVGRLVGYSNAFLWGVTGRSLNAQQARDIGFVQEVVPDERLMAHCKELAREIIDNCPPITVQLFKLALAEDHGRFLGEMVDLTAQAQQVSRATEDHTEALRAYIEGRPPGWRAR